MVVSRGGVINRTVVAELAVPAEFLAVPRGTRIPAVAELTVPAGGTVVTVTVVVPVPVVPVLGLAGRAG